MNRFHVERMTQNESNPLTSTQIGQPVPRKDAFDRDDDVLAERIDRFQERLRIGLHVAMKNDRTELVHHAQVHCSRVQINSTVMGMLLRIESHWGLLLFCRPSGTTYTLGW